MDWEALEGTLGSGPASASWGEGEVQVFCTFPDGQVWSRYWDLTSWHRWESLGGSFTGRPAAAARSADRIDLLAVREDGVLCHRWWDGERWVPWEEVEDAPRGGRGVGCNWVGDRLDIFVWGAEGGLWHAALSPELG